MPQNITIMDIVDRLKLFMQSTGLSSTQFADQALIPRPSFSQIISGRNKKISNEIFAKLHDAFPYLNIMWLMFGDGDMVNGGNFTKPVEEELPPTPHQVQVEFDPLVDSIDVTPSETIAFDTANKEVKDKKGLNKALENPLGCEINKKDMNESPSPAVIHDVISAKRDTSKSIASIMVFYSDNSFEIFKPA